MDGSKITFLYSIEEEQMQEVFFANHTSSL